MVPTAALKELRRAYEELRDRTLEVRRYSPPLFDVVFDLITHDAAIAGGVHTLLDGHSPSTEITRVLREPLKIEGDGLVHEGKLIDLSAYPEVLNYARDIERLRLLADRVLRGG